ncbi:MAG: hypothetical protein GY816_03080 [Cytophagales bacterium]|nr:hypothetical protein [Cytophagales bacterium]
MFGSNRRKRRKEGEEIITDSLIKAELREIHEIVSDEIDELLNTGNFDLNSVNIYSSKIGEKVRFFVDSPGELSYENCCIYDWGGWSMIKERGRFELSAWRMGIREVNEIKVRV